MSQRGLGQEQLLPPPRSHLQPQLTKLKAEGRARSDLWKVLPEGQRGFSPKVSLPCLAFPLA